MSRLPSVLGPAVVVAGCALFPESEARVIGQILTDTNTLFLRTIVAPDTVTRNTPFTVTINSFGSSSCTTPDGVTMSTDAATVVRIVPYDRVPRGQEVCTLDFSPRPHPVEIRLPAPGPATIRAVGRVGKALDSVEHPLHVRP